MKQKKVWISDIDEETQSNVLSKSKRLATYIIIALIFQSCASSYEIVIEDEPIEIKTTKKAIERW